jgi:predicted RecB family nuclease
MWFRVPGSSTADLDLARHGELLIGAVLRIHQGGLVFSATDLVNFLGCRHAAFLDRKHLDEPLPLSPEDPLLKLLQAKGLAHELGYLESLRAEDKTVVEIPTHGSLLERVALTREAMASGADVIFQGALLKDRWQGYADFLIKVPGSSKWGSYVYEPVDTKLSLMARPKHAMQLSVYARLVGAEQGVAPAHMHIVLGDNTVATVRVAEIHSYFEAARQRLERFVDPLPEISTGEPCSHCAQCRWSEHCEAEWEKTDHLSLIANITRSQTGKLEAAGISTVAALGALTPETRIPDLQPAIFQRLQRQARLQIAKRKDGKNRVELLAPVGDKGFSRLPEPNPGDLFFDMEGDPLIALGLEYLFGFVHVMSGKEVFVPFWGHTREAERKAFEQAMDFITTQLAAFPEAHVYHYAKYEESALKRLAMMHGTREAELDNLLRTGKLVDLYRIVREGIQISEPRYSIKNLESFYMPPRSGKVKSADTSIVVYEEWRQLQDPKLLQEIADYNEEDCRSTLKLRDWLVSLKPGQVAWYDGVPAETIDPERVARRREAEQRAADTVARLAQAPLKQQPFRELVGHLLEFHRREDKPTYWAMFHRKELSEDELVEDAECIGGLRHDPLAPPYVVKRSKVHTFRFPPQDFKMRVGQRPKRAATLHDAGEIVFVDEEAGQIALKIGAKAAAYEEDFSLIPQGPIDADAQREAIYRFGESVIAGDDEYAAVKSLLNRERPRVEGLKTGAPIIADGVELLTGASSAIARLDRSTMLVQGPPGTGKTYLSAHTIVDLLAQGKRIGVASNSHKAINNLLMEVEKQALERKVNFRGAKKCSEQEHQLNGSMIVDLFDNDEVSSGGYDLIAGTAWLLARPEFDQSLDTLFIDEAGQVSIANVVAMGVSARNIVLVGDQMQLGQPMKGAHPGESGTSALEFVMGDMATVPPDRGIFLPVTRRMHPDVCRFISEAVYEGRLQPAPGNSKQRLKLNPGADAALRPTGISFVPVVHEDCSQKCEEEAQRIQALYRSLLTQSWTNQEGETLKISEADILVVSPYNMQVNLLKSVLPDGARVGTVDKFQGQEAAVVLISMTASSAEDISRGIEFLYSRNRLNVAISRAQCLAIVVASPQLLEAPCNTIEQMKLVNTLCFVKAYADSAKSEVSVK